MKIVVITLTMFVGSAGHIQAMGQRDGGGRDAFHDANPERSSSRSYGIIGGYSVMEVMTVVQEIKAMDKRANRGWKGLSNLSTPGSSRNPVTPPYSYRPQDHKDCLRDVLRNLPEFGGPANAYELLYEEHCRTIGASSLCGDYNSNMVQMMAELCRFQHNH